MPGQARIDGEPSAPLLLFDSDDFLYTFTSVDALRRWFEPMMQEEVTGCFDGSARVVTVRLTGRSWEVGLGDGNADEDALRSHTLAFLTRHEPGQLGLAELPIAPMVEALTSLTRYAIA